MGLIGDRPVCLRWGADLPEAGARAVFAWLVAVSWGTAEHGDWRGYAPRGGDAFARTHVQVRMPVPHPIIDTPPAFEGVPITV